MHWISVRFYEMGDIQIWNVFLSSRDQQNVRSSKSIKKKNIMNIPKIKFVV